jgi:hypothetical protein
MPKSRRSTLSSRTLDAQDTRVASPRVLLPALPKRRTDAAQEANANRLVGSMHDFALRLELPGRNDQSKAVRQRRGLLELDLGPAERHVAHNTGRGWAAPRASHGVTDCVAAAELATFGTTQRRMFLQLALPQRVNRSLPFRHCLFVSGAGTNLGKCNHDLGADCSRKSGSRPSCAIRQERTST